MSELDDRIAALPRLVDDPAYLVFADWLQSRGDAWGELFVLQSRAPHAVEAWLAQHGEVLLDPLYGPRGEAQSKLVRAEWHYGFLRTVMIETPADRGAIVQAIQSMRRRATRSRTARSCHSCTRSICRAVHSTTRPGKR